MRNESECSDKEIFFADQGLERVDLSYLPDELAKAARELVGLKYHIDLKGRTHSETISPDLHGCSTCGEWGPYFGHDFFCNIIPFLPDWEVQPIQNLLVPTLYTFGCSWRWWPDRYTNKDDFHGINEHIFSRYGLEATRYTFIPQLGLFLAGEGMNRVNFCRQHDIEHIPARVFTHNYPEPNRISIYELHIAGGLDVWAVLDDRYVQKIGHYDYALPLLKAYGVSVHVKWPILWPSISELLDNEMDCREISAFNRDVIDMESVKEVLARREAKRRDGEQYVKTHLFILPVKGMRRFTLVATFLCILSCMASLFLGEGMAGNIAQFITAFIAGAFFVVIPRFFWIKRKHLSD